MFKRLVSLVLLLLVSPFCLAQQRIPIQAGSTATVTLSPGLNRIAIENDRIVHVEGIQGQFQLDKDANLGHIFIKPIATDKEEPIHLFLTTEGSHVYTLRLLTSEAGDENILLVPLDAKPAAQWEQSSAYERLIKTLVQAMHTQTPIEGFWSENVKATFPRIPGTKIKQVQTYTSDKLQAHVLEVLNTKKEPLFLEEALFYSPEVRAVSIVNPMIPVNGKTTVYWVR